MAACAMCGMDCNYCGRPQGKDTIDQLREFHKAFNCYAADVPEIPVQWENNKVRLHRLANLLSVVAHDAWLAAAECGQGTAQQAVFTRVQLIAEEFGETVEAIANRDLVAVLDGLCDLQYVTDGTWLTLGMGDLKEDAFAEVHRSNMAKLVNGEPLINDAGRVVKPKGWTPPDLAQFLEEK